MLDGLPASVRVGGHDITILVVKDLEVEKGKCWGSYSSKELTIRLDAGQLTPIFAFDTLFHEITHAVYDIWCLQKGDSEERIASVMASGWTAVLRSNPELVEWMQGALAGPTSSDTIRSRTSSQEAGS